MWKISVNLIWLAAPGAAICAGALALELGDLYPVDQLANAKTRSAPPAQVRAVAFGAPALCWTIGEPIGASVTQGAQAERPAFAQTCSSGPTPSLFSQPRIRLALAR
jgi:hypothetical protein